MAASQANEIEEMEDQSFEVLQTPAQLEEMDSSQAPDPTTSQAVEQLEINDLVTELRQSSPNLEKALGDFKAAWNEILVRKLVDAQVDPTDVMVKKLVDQQMETTSNKIDDLLSVLVHDVTSVMRFKNRVTFEIDPNSLINIIKWIYLGDLSFEVCLCTLPVDLFVTCTGIPADKSCKVRVDVTIKNHAGRRDFVRCFSKVLTNSSPILNALNSKDRDRSAVRSSSYNVNDQYDQYAAYLDNCPTNELEIMNLMEETEYKDESLGFLKDGKLVVEVVVYADDQQEDNQLPNNQPTSNQLALTASQFVLRAESLARSEDKLLFELEPTKKRTNFKYRKYVFVRGLTFDVMLFNCPIELLIIGCDIPAQKSCKARIEVTVKNQAGQEDWARRLSKVFCDSDKKLSLKNLIAEEEYADESFGFLKDGILLVEVAIQIDQPF